MLGSFNKDTYCFQASNGFVLKSLAVPSIDKSARTLCVQGDKPRCSSDIISTDCPKYMEDLTVAVMEYNM